MQLTPRPGAAPGCPAAACAQRPACHRAAQPQRRRRRGTALGAVIDRPSQGGGQGVLERPGLDLSQAPVPQTDKGFGSTESGGGKTTGGGKHRVLLLDSPKHTEKKVVDAILKIVSGVTPEHALNSFNTSKELGQAIIISCIKEMAEFYAEQLNKDGVRSAIEPDSTVL